MSVKNRDLDLSRFTYDPDTGIVMRRHKNGDVKPFGTVNHHGYLVGKIGRVNVQVHRLAWRLHFGVWPSDILDHRDEDKVNNRIGNLREATDALNRLNNGKQANNTSGFKGVYLDRSMAGGPRPWMAKIIRDGRRHCLGHYATPEEAAAAYDKACVRIHGEFGSLNGEATGERLSQVRKRKVARVGLKGVTEIRRDSGKVVFKAMVMIDGKHTFLGLFDTAEQAAVAYDEAVATDPFAPKRVLNFPLTNLSRMAFYPPPPKGFIMPGEAALRRRQLAAQAA